MRIVKIGQFGAKLRTFENREKLRKIIELHRLGKNRLFLVIFCEFRQID